MTFLAVMIGVALAPVATSGATILFLHVLDRELRLFDRRGNDR